MSYDLLFIEPAISLADFQSYFAKIPNYRVEGLTAIYENEETGVYFRFECNDQTSTVHDAEEPPHYAAFDLNYFRPSFFALEAAPEISAFVRHFGCKIGNARPGNQGVFDENHFIEDWNYGNESSYGTIRRLHGDSMDGYHFRPEQELLRIWRWNYTRKSRSEAMRDDLFIPKIFWGLFDGILKSFCAWPDAIPSILPPVDGLWISRTNLAPQPLFGKKSDDQCFVPFETMRPLLEPYYVDSPTLPSFKLPLTVPSPILDRVRRLEPMKSKVTGIHPERVLVKELIEQPAGSARQIEILREPEL